MRIETTVSVAAPLVGRIYRGLAARYVDLEATGIKRRAEAAS